MSENSSIEWCDHTFNPWIGCTKVSPGCAHCYAETLMDTRYGRVKWGKGQPRQRTSEANWKLPDRWSRKPRIHNVEANTLRKARVFCGSLCDWLDDEVPIEWLADLLGVINDTPNLDWLLLTKRPENFQDRVMGAWETARCAMDMLARWKRLSGQAIPPPNVWIGTSVEDQVHADERIPELLKIPAKVRFLSVEPMLGEIDLQYAAFNGADSLTKLEGIHWAIFGGESGKGSRPCAVEWIRDGVMQCRSAGVAPFVKQLGTNPILEPGPITYPTEDLKGGDMSEWPEDLRVREFPMTQPQPKE